MRGFPKKVGIALLPFFLGSCSFNPFTTDNHLTGSASGAAIGAVAGGGVAGLLGGNRAVIVLSALTGGALGYYVTTLTAAAAGIQAAGGIVFVQGDYVTINLPTDPIFDSNSSELLPAATPALESVIAVLNHFPNNSIIVSGNTSGFGTHRHERKLSEKRASEVAHFLWQHGISSGCKDSPPSHQLDCARTIYVGYGDFFPIANHIRAVSIRQNSRIQITAYPPHGTRHASASDQLFANIGSPQDAVNAGIYTMPTETSMPPTWKDPSIGSGEEPISSAQKSVYYK